MKKLELDDMQIHEYCDYCCAEPKHFVTCLFGVRICEDCEAKFVRSKPKKIPMNKSMKRYLRKIESGRRPAPFRMSVTRGDETDHLPIDLTLAGEPK